MLECLSYNSCSLICAFKTALMSGLTSQARTWYQKVSIFQMHDTHLDRLERLAGGADTSDIKIPSASCWKQDLHPHAPLLARHSGP